MKTLFSIFILLVLIIGLNSCSDDEAVNNPTIKWTDNTSTYNVVYNDNTIVFEQNDLADLISIDTAKYIYTFNESNSKAKNLKVGDVIIIYGKALRKVKSVKTQQTKIVVETAYATMNQAIKSGNISWDYGCQFNSDARPTIMLEGKKYDPVLQDGNLNWDITLNGIKYTITMELAGESAKVKFEIEKNLGDNAGAKFIAEGTMNRFRSKSDMNFDNSTMTNFSNSNDGLSGDMKLSLVVAASGTDGINVELPIILLKYPFMVGPIPVLINVKAQIVVNAVVPIAASSQVTAKFKYNSKTGFKYDGYDFSTDGNIGSYSMDKDKAQTGSPSSISANFGIGFPRLELSLFGETVVPWIQTAFLIGGYYNFNPACQEAKAQFIGGCGIDFSFFGIEKSLTKNLWQEEKILMQAGDCAK